EARGFRLRIPDLQSRPTGAPRDAEPSISEGAQKRNLETRVREPRLLPAGDEPKQPARTPECRLKAPEHPDRVARRDDIVSGIQQADREGEPSPPCPRSTTRSSWISSRTARRSPPRSWSRCSASRFHPIRRPASLRPT